jgi:low affinity Fe/Cu permease
MARKPRKKKLQHLAHEPAVRRERFGCLARRISCWAGHPSTFVGACAVVVVWALVGKFFDFSDTWQLVINTGTTIVTFLMVFLIQNTQNRDMYALQLKLDELIRATNGAHTVLLDLEELSEEELVELRDRYEELASDARKRLRTGKTDIDSPEIRMQ